MDLHCRARCLLIVLTIALLAPRFARAQDAQYWDNQYGTKAQLLGGLVVGSPSDLSATYYNPAWVAMGVDASLLVTTIAVEYSSLNLKHALGDGTNPGYDRLGSSPGFLAGRFNALKLEGWQLAWSVIERVKFLYDAAGLRIDEHMLPSQPEDTWKTAEAFRQTKTEESWYGFTFSRAIGEHTAFGATPYLAYRSQNQRIQGTSRALNGMGDEAATHLVNEFSFSHYRLLAKFGLAFDYEPVTFGVTLTTPGLGIYGSGDVYSHLSASGIDLDGNGSPDDFVVANAQEDLTATWKSPLSLAVGLAWRNGNTGLHFTAEWFDAVSQEQVLDPAPFNNQTTSDRIYWNIGIEQNSVLNYGLGLDHRFSNKFSLYGAVRSDRSTLDSDPNSSLLMATWDLWHFSTGASFQFMGVGFTSGLQYSLGSGTADQFMDLSEDNADGILAPLQHAELRYRRLKFVVGFDLALLTSSSEQ